MTSNIPIKRPPSSRLYIRYVVDEAGFGVVYRNTDHFPIQLPGVNHGKNAQGLHFVDTSALVLLAPNLNHIDRIIVPLW